MWDESFLWGVMSVNALQEAGLPFELIRADEVGKGGLEKYGLLFVPGGWSSNKMKALGEAGVGAIRKFVNAGGDYLGFCGGAGLATLDGIGLLNIRRRPTKDRVPSFSGRIRLRTADHPVLDKIASPVFHAWWPPQFMVEDDRIKVLAQYENPLPDAFSSDLNVGDVKDFGSWADLEKTYGINLDPGRIFDEPAVVEGSCGKGKVILSLVHFDTPGDPNGMTVLRELWKYFSAQDEPTPASGKERASTDSAGRYIQGISELESAVAGIIDLGLRNFLWFWKNHMLLQWRRGVRGLEYCTLYIMIREISALAQTCPPEKIAYVEDRIKEISGPLVYFSGKAKRLLILERLAMQKNHITYEKCDDTEIRALREELFSASKSHGGLFKKVVDDMDSLLYSLLR